jgi:CubicO group peptidase (beta-lactamase class C family)
MKLSSLLPVVFCVIGASSHAAANIDQASVKQAVDQAILPLMQQYGIPGMAVGITIDGQRHFHEYGVAYRETRQPITSDSLFEIGSISKTFTATLASYAQVKGKLSLLDNASSHLPSLRASSFDNISLLNLATHTSGGLPLQVPSDIDNADQLMDYFKYWSPPHAPGTVRTYSNPGIGLLGMIAAGSLRLSFDDAIEKTLFPVLGMRHSYLRVPPGQVRNYAQGYTKNDEPIRMSRGLLASEAYGVKSGTVDMVRFIEANLQASLQAPQLHSELQRALLDTHTGHFQAGTMTQALAWERYPYPVELKKLLAGNSDAMAYQATPTTALSPGQGQVQNQGPGQQQGQQQQPAPAPAWINKTGSTNGFAAYVAFVPSKNMGIVILANKNYPVDARVTAAYRILTQLDGQAGAQD